MRRVGCIVLALIGVSGCGAAHHAATAPALAIVGGQRIDSNEMRHYLSYATQYYSRPSGDVRRESPLRCSVSSTNPVCATVKRQVLARLLQEHVVLTYAAVHHINLSNADEGRVGVAMHDRTIFRATDMSFLRQVLRRELLVQKVESAIMPVSAKRGPSFHVRKFWIPVPAKASASSVYRQALNLATDGTPIPVGTRIRAEWEARFRLPRSIRQALEYANSGQYVGPFATPGGYLVVQMVGRAVHSYGAPARNELLTRYFRGWLTQQIEAQHPRCFDRRGRNLACPV